MNCADFTTRDGTSAFEDESCNETASDCFTLNDRKCRKCQQTVGGNLTDCPIDCWHEIKPIHHFLGLGIERDMNCSGKGCLLNDRPCRFCSLGPNHIDLQHCESYTDINSQCSSRITDEMRQMNISARYDSSCTIGQSLGCFDNGLLCRYCREPTATFNTTFVDCQQENQEIIETVDEMEVLCKNQSRLFSNEIDAFFDPNCTSSSPGCIHQDLPCRFCSKDDKTAVLPACDKPHEEEEEEEDETSIDLSTEYCQQLLTPGDVEKGISAYSDETCAGKSTYGCFPAGMLCRYCSTTSTGPHVHCPSLLSSDGIDCSKEAKKLQQVGLSAIEEHLCTEAHPIVKDCIGNRIPCRLCSVGNETMNDYYDCTVLKTIVAVPDLKKRNTGVVEKESVQFSENYYGLIVLGCAIVFGLIVILREKRRLRRERSLTTENQNDTPPPPSSRHLLRPFTSPKDNKMESV